jgi:histidine triad (HIT) family protein
MCLFCDIIEKKKEANIVYEDDAAVAFLDIFARTEGHTLVVPKKHAETMLELSEGEQGPFWIAVRRTAELLKEKLSPQGFTIGVNHGKVSGQEIEHLHVHIMPRYEGDSGGSIQSVVNNPGVETVEEVYKKIIT